MIAYAATRKGIGKLDVNDKALREEYQEDGSSIRRNVSLLLHSAGIRNVHDVMVALGLGAQALVPYAMLEFAVQANPEPAVAASNLLLLALGLLRWLNADQHLVVAAKRL